MRKHLYSDHFTEWVEMCDEIGVEITAKDPELQRLLRDYRKRSKNGGEMIEGEKGDLWAEEPQHRSYSHEAFVTAIIEWIVSDDQVISPFFLPVSLINEWSFRHSMLLKTPSYEVFFLCWRKTFKMRTFLAVTHSEIVSYQYGTHICRNYSRVYQRYSKRHTGIHTHT